MTGVSPKGAAIAQAIRAPRQDVQLEVRFTFLRKLTRRASSQLRARPG
jgi:hypothetical protein